LLGSEEGVRHFCIVTNRSDPKGGSGLDIISGVDLKNHEYAVSEADDFIVGDLRDPYLCRQVIDRRFDEVYQLAADMGGAGFVFVGENDADIMHNSGLINLNLWMRAVEG